MTKADEILKELGYATIFDNYTDRLIYGKMLNSNAENVCFEFIEKDKILNLSSGYYNMQLLQAINEKIKELGWIENG